MDNNGITGLTELVGGAGCAHLEKIMEFVHGFRMTSHMKWKIKVMFETTNQILSNIYWYKQKKKTNVLDVCDVSYVSNVMFVISTTNALETPTRSSCPLLQLWPLMVTLVAGTQLVRKGLVQTFSHLTP